MNNHSVFIRNQTQKGFTIIQNNILKNQNLSLSARGLICTLLSFPDNWEFSIYGLTKIFSDKESAIKRAIKEIEDAGYLWRDRKRGEHGRFCGWVWTVFDTPHEKTKKEEAKQTKLEESHRHHEKPTVGFTDCRFHRLSAKCKVGQ